MSSLNLIPDQAFCASWYCRQRSVPAELPRGEILLGDAARMLQDLPAASVDCVITSPPYFLLRDYGVQGQVGLERTVNDWVSSVLAVCDELARVLKPTGSLWLNLGDSYSRHDRYGAPAKSLLLGPERVLLALSARGWIVRSKVVWAKPNPMPNSVRDRLSCCWEPLYLLVRQQHYFFDLDAIRVPHTSSPRLRRKSCSRHRPQHRPPARAKYETGRPAWAGPLAGANDGLARVRADGRVGHPMGKNPGDVWTIATAGFRGAHFATFPVRLVERALLATCPVRACQGCGRAWIPGTAEPMPSCGCGAPWRPGLVLDPFMGSGTVAEAAEKHGRDWIGIELNPTYVELASKRIREARSKRDQSQHEGQVM